MEEEVLLERQEIDGKTECGSLLLNTKKWWKEVLEEEVLLERQEIDGKTLWKFVAQYKKIVEGSLGGRSSAGTTRNRWEDIVEVCCSIQKNGVQQQDVGVIG